MNLDRRIKIQNYTTAANDFGELIKTWATFWTCWAGVKFTTGTEKQDGEQFIASNVVNWTIRSNATYGDNVTAKMRILYKTEYYYINVVKQLGRSDFIELETKLKDNE